MIGFSFFSYFCIIKYIFQMKISTSFDLILVFCYVLVVAVESKVNFDLDLVAEFVTVDYLWDSSHSRSLYEESGQFVVANNAIAGIKVSAQNDIFVSVPRWMSGVPSSLNKLVSNPNGKGFVLSPWPSWSFNAIGSGHLQYTQSFTIDSKNRMWIAEVGRTNFYDANPNLVTKGRPGLLVVDIATGQLLSSYYFPSNILSNNASFLNDIVLDEVNGYAYFTNTWGNGGIVVYNIATNQSHSFTSLATQRNTSYNFCVNNICYGTNGVGASPSDGIALSSDGSRLFWSAVQGQGLYSIATNLLWDFSLTNTAFQQQVIFSGYKTGCSDGLLFVNGNLFYGNLQSSAVGLIEDVLRFDQVPNSLQISDSILSTESPYTLNWIDTFAIDFNNNNALYFTSNRLNLFFSNAMDFTGQSGSNFRIYHCTTSTDNSDDNALSSGQLAGLIVGTVLFVVLSFVYRYKCNKN